MPGYKSFSFTAVWAKIGDHVDKLLSRWKAAPPAPAPAVVSATHKEALRAQLAAIAPDIEASRLEVLHHIDRRARLWVPLAGGAALVILLTVGADLLSLLVFSLLAATGGFFAAMARPAEAYRKAIKSQLARTVTGSLHGLSHEVAPETDLARLRSWHLFPELQSAITEDRLTGNYNGRSLSLSEMNIAYERASDRGEPDRRVSVSVIEAATSGDAPTQLVLAPHRAPGRTRPVKSDAGRLIKATSGDAAFDEAYLMLITEGSEVQLSAGLRDAIMKLADVTLMGRPWLVFLPGYLAVLFRIPLEHLAFEVSPYWVPFDPDAVLDRFLPGLASRLQLIDAVMELPPFGKTEA